jgi:hypothetical protein
VIAEMRSAVERVRVLVAKLKQVEQDEKNSSTPSYLH